jgi:hypothetical protein
MDVHVTYEISERLHVERFQKVIPTIYEIEPVKLM